jgi:predicted MFS family arabinose efflux permease
MADASTRASVQMAPLARDGQASAAISGARSIYIVTMFTAVSMLSVADQFSFSILLEPMRRDLRVSDTAMGMLVGAASSIVFAIAGIPIARLADLGNRRNLLAAATALWSLATLLCGAASSFLQLMSARIGVAAAEAAAQPSFVSMIGDLFAPARRGIAIAIVMMGGSAGIVVGSIVAGTVSAHYNWHLAFVVLGIPGLLLGLLFWLTVPEPQRGAKDGAPEIGKDTATMLAALRYLLSVPTAWRLILASMLLLTAQSAMRVWLPTFFVRVHSMTMSQMGASFGLIMGLSSILSMMISAFLSDWLAARGERWRICFIASALLVGIPFVAAATLVNNVWIVWTLIIIFQLLWGGIPPVISAAGLGVVQPRARALWVSLYYFAGAGLGGLCGPLLVGFLSDQLTNRFGELGLRYGMLVIPALLLPAALAYLWSSFTADRDAKLIADSGCVSTTRSIARSPGQ